MNKRLNRYETYHTVDYDYVDELPTGWRLLPNIAIFEERKEKRTTHEELLSVSSYKGIVKNSGEDRKDRSSEDKSEYLLVKEGDLAYNTMLMWSGAIGYSPFRGVVSPSYTVLKPKIKINPKYFHYQFRSEFYRNYARRYSYGIVDSRLRLYYFHFKRMYSIVPPLEIQNAVVAYLDTKAEEIERFIKNKEHQIELLDEERVIIINQAITKGIGPNTNLQSSGINWIGEIPGHWKILPLNYRYEVQLGKMLDAKRIAGTQLAPYLRNTDVQWGRINTNNLPLMDFSKSDRKKYALEKGDLLVCEGGEVGRCAIWTEQISDCFYQKALHRVRPLKTTEDTTSFLYYLMFAASKRGLFSATGNLNTIEHLTAEKLKKHRFPFPPIEEQRQIVRFIQSKTDELDSTVAKIQKEIKVISDYRESLITNVVLGQTSIPS